MEPYKQLRLPPQHMEFPVLKPIDFFVHELQVIGPKNLSHKQVHLHMRETACDVSPSIHNRIDKYRSFDKGSKRRVGKKGQGWGRVCLRKTLTFFLCRPLSLLKMAGWLLWCQLNLGLANVQVGTSLAPRSIEDRASQSMGWYIFQPTRIISLLWFVCLMVSILLPPRCICRVAQSQVKPGVTLERREGKFEDLH